MKRQPWRRSYKLHPLTKPAVEPLTFTGTPSSRPRKLTASRIRDGNPSTGVVAGKKQVVPRSDPSNGKPAYHLPADGKHQSSYGRLTSSTANVCFDLRTVELTKLVRIYRTHLTRTYPMSKRLPALRATLNSSLAFLTSYRCRINGSLRSHSRIQCCGG